jgi:hypothetical protein
MTEGVWQRCGDCFVMLEFVRRCAVPSARKRLLWSIGCWRHAPGWISQENAQRLAGAAEQFADGRIDEDELMARAKDCPDGPVRVTKSRASYRLSGWRMLPANYTLGDESQQARRLGADLLRDVLGNPVRPRQPIDARWRTHHVVELATSLYEGNDFSDMLKLADWLQEAGCDDSEMLTHCRSGPVHVRGCWVVDLVLGRE